ncbi:MAG: heavy-metal-associated domain-containing protein [Acholeplasmataceae bacterium]|nr:heavy-metal-associated domain-containing protein [Acholeplasmataceae bacterium]
MAIKNYKMSGLTCEGCTCGHCGQPILIYLRCLEGVSKVSPDFNLDTVLIEYDQNVTSSADIIELVQKRGFQINEI